MEVADETVDIEAEYALEHPVKCPSCSSTLKAFSVVRTLRTKVNFTSNLPRRGYAIICPDCEVVLSAMIGSRVL